MNLKLIAASAVAVAVAVVAATLAYVDDAPAAQGNEKLGLVINTPHSEITLQELHDTYQMAADSSGIGRSNVYMFWNIIEPERDMYEWNLYDGIMGVNEKNGLKVTLYFSIINGKTLGPFPDWIGNPNLANIPSDELVDALDAVLDRYHIIDSVIISAGTDEHFRYQQRDIPVFEDLFGEVYEATGEQHPGVQMGNSFELHNTLNKGLTDVVRATAFGDFVAFTYLPTDTLNEINKTPSEAVQDLEMLMDIVPDRKIGIFETGWSTSGAVGGSTDDQTSFVNELYGFYDRNEENIEFVTWYRLYDRPEGTCVIDESELEGTVTFGNSTFVIERLGNYICNAGLLTVNDMAKPGWGEFVSQTTARVT